MSPVLPPLEICLVTWNHYATTRACLATLLAADYPGECRVWVTDNASADETVSAIRAEYPAVHLLENTWNAGFASAMNRMLNAITALDEPEERLILLLNNDTLVDPALLTTLATALVEHPEAGVVAPTIYYADTPDTLWYAGGGLDAIRCRAWHEGIRTTEAVGGVPRPTGYATGCALMTRSSVVRQVGALDEGYFMYWEDADFCQRARTAGWEILWVPEAKLWHKVSTSTGGNFAPRKMWRKFKSGLRFWGRHHEESDWPLRFCQSAWQDYQTAKSAP